MGSVGGDGIIKFKVNTHYSISESIRDSSASMMVISGGKLLTPS